MQLQKFAAKSWMFCKVFLIYCGLGGFCGAAIGLILFLHLGPLKTPEDAGYATALFIKAGVQFGIFVWTLRGVMALFHRKVHDSTKKGLESKVIRDAN